MDEIKSDELSRPMKFGKHRGETIGDVLREDPQYLVWAVNNIEWFTISDSLMEHALEMAEAQKIEQAYIRSYGRFGDDNDWGGLTDADFSCHD